MNQPVEVPKEPATLPAPREIVIRETGTQVAYACPTCGLLFIFASTDTEEDRKDKHDRASTHCVKTCACGKPIEYHYMLRCRDCRQEKETQKKKQVFERAKKVSIDDYPDDPIFWEDGTGDLESDGYFSGLDALLDYCESEGVDLPAYVWACTKRPFSMNAADLVLHNCSSQDIDTQALRLSDVDYAELQTSLDAWIGKHRGALDSWFQDTSRAVLLRDFEEKD